MTVVNRRIAYFTPSPAHVPWRAVPVAVSIVKKTFRLSPLSRPTGRPT